VPKVFFAHLVKIWGHFSRIETVGCDTKLAFFISCQNGGFNAHKCLFGISNLEPYFSDDFWMLMVISISDLMSIMCSLETACLIT